MKIDVYKIGEANYKNIDLNGGSHEAKLIKQAVATVDTKQSVLLIINGAFVDEQEEYKLYRLMSEYELRMFILTDDFSFVSNNDIMDECEVILHQYPDKNLIESSKTNFYSWVPELFYKSSEPATALQSQNNTLLYGGGVRDMEMAELLLKYSGVKSHDFRLKTSSYDNRLDYESFNKLQRKSMFSLIISRKHYSKYGFVTPRFVEAISNWSYPIVDASYDISEHFVKAENKVTSAKQATSIMNELSQDTFKRALLICEYAKKLESTKDNFTKLIKELTK